MLTPPSGGGFSNYSLVDDNTLGYRYQEPDPKGSPRWLMDAISGVGLCVANLTGAECSNPTCPDGWHVSSRFVITSEP